jgi:hypothetical protein
MLNLSECAGMGYSVLNDFPILDRARRRGRHDCDEQLFFFLPIRSDSLPPMEAPKNIPRKDAAVMSAMVDSFSQM